MQRVSGALFAVTMTLLAGATLPAQAQTSAPPPPVRSFVDANGVDLLSGTLRLPQTLLSIGQEGNGQKLTESFVNSAGTGSLTGTIHYNSSGYWVSMGDQSELFAVGAGSSFFPSGRGSLLTVDATTFTYTTRDGTVATFSKTYASDYPSAANQARLTQIVRPSGEVVTYTYYAYNLCIPSGQGCTNVPAHGLQSVTSTLGYQINQPWESGVTARNNALGVTVSKRAGLFTAASVSTTTPGVTEMVVTYPSGRVVTFTLNSARRVTKVVEGGATYNYSYSDSGDDRTVVVSGPLSYSRTVISSIANARVKSDTDASNATTSFEYGAWGRIERIVKPEGNYTNYTYDSRGNVTEQREVSKTLGTPADIVIKAGYDATCANPKTCNQANWVEDARGNRTDYVYDPSHGGVLTVTEPAGRDGVRPQTRYTYTQLYAWYAPNNSGPIAQAPTPVWKLTGVSSCIRGQAPACVGTAAEVRTTISYGVPGTPNTLLPTSITHSAGDGSLSSTSTMTYDGAGNVTLVDGPLAGDVDKEYSFYNASRQLIGEIGPDPDGSGPLERRSTRITYHPDGAPSLVETGHTASTTTVDGMTVLQAVSTAYDGQSRKILEAVLAGGVKKQVTQFSYDTKGRVQCVAERMNTAEFEALPASACSLGASGVDGPDRITRFTYAATDRVIKVASGDLVAARTVEEKAYTANGLVDWVMDGEGNKSDYTYDGFDRLLKLALPVTTKGGQAANSGDYEEYGYDAASNALSARLRDGRLITSEYDGRNRAWTMSVGASIDTPAATYTFGYDNLDNTVSASDGTLTIAREYDALKRLSWENSGLGRVDYEYDSASRRKKLTWPDGFYVNYDYDNTDAISAIRRANSISASDRIAAITYDNLGRRVSVVRGDNKVNTTYAYSASDLLPSSLTHTPTSVGDSVQYGFTYNAVSQIKQRTISNAAYVWNGAYAVNRPYETDGLNRLNEAGSKPQAPAVTAPGYNTYEYDGRGNLKCVGSRSDQAACVTPSVTYLYDAENRLRGTSAGASLVYDPLGRLFTSTTVGGTTTRYLYDGVNVIGEYSNSGTLQRRYVFGDGADEVLVRYTGSGTTPEYLLADHQGSIIAATDSNGVVTSKLTYDEYGVPGPGNVGLFQYTGQVYLSDLSLYHYKARAYSPTLGRFLQTDPTGYDDGLNWYAYVGNDPLNATDPSGLCGVAFDVPGDPSNGVASGVGGGPCASPFDQYKADYWRSLDGVWNSGVTQFGLGFIPGYDLFKCTEATCSDGQGNLNAAGWAAVAGLVPAGKALKLLKAGKAVEGVAKACNCFAAGTLVAVEEGYRPIEAVKVGDRVLARDDMTGETALKPVVALIPGEARVIWEVTVEISESGDAVRRETIHTTEEHPFRTVDGAWTPTALLKVGAQIVTATGEATIVQVSRTSRIERTYNLEVGDFHTYFVGKNQAWVHNACLKDAKRAMDGNKAFKDFFHRWKQKSGYAGDGAGQRNRNMTDEEILEAYEDWLADRSPGRKR